MYRFRFWHHQPKMFPDLQPSHQWILIWYQSFLQPRYQPPRYQQPSHFKGPYLASIAYGLVNHLSCYHFSYDLVHHHYLAQT